MSSEKGKQIELLNSLCIGDNEFLIKAKDEMT